MKVAAIIPAAGKGRRIKSNIEKPYIRLCGKPILAHVLLELSKNKRITEIIVSVNKKSLTRIKRDIINRFSIRKVKVVSGGKERQDSIFNALGAVSKNIDYILIHDGVRPFINKELIALSLLAAKKFGSSVVAVPVKPTLKYSEDGRFIKYTPDRGKFWEAQTPQVFRKDLIEKAYKKISRKRINVTDDAMLVERLGLRPRLVMGSYSNIKITTQEDLELAKQLMEKRS